MKVLIECDGDGTIRALGKCLDIAGGATGNSAQVQPYDPQS